MKHRADWLPYGLVAMCFLLNLATRGVGESFGVFVPSLQAAFDAERAVVTSVYGLGMLAMGLGGPFAGLLLDRIGPRVLVLAGLVCAGGGTLLAAQASAVWQLHATLGVAA
ncbi:MAG TPA: MFS transporter, partial [Vineibacter sp.]|nr:MFS transporter [Vineibacter sp.]